MLSSCHSGIPFIILFLVFVIWTLCLGSCGASSQGLSSTDCTTRPCFPKLDPTCTRTKRHGALRYPATQAALFSKIQTISIAKHWFPRLRRAFLVTYVASSWGCFVKLFFTPTNAHVDIYWWQMRYCRRAVTVMIEGALLHYSSWIE